MPFKFKFRHARRRLRHGQWQAVAGVRVTVGRRVLEAYSITAAVLEAYDRRAARAGPGVTSLTGRLRSLLVTVLDRKSRQALQSLRVQTVFPYFVLALAR